MPREYKVDKETSALWVIDDAFITRIHNRVRLRDGGSGRYLFYDSNMAVDIATDFRSKMTILGEYPRGTSQFFGASTIHVNDDGIIVFGLRVDHDAIIDGIPPKSGVSSDIFNAPIKKVRSALACMSSSSSSGHHRGDHRRSFGSVNDIIPDETVSYDNYLFTRDRPPVVITPGPMGYVIGGYNVYVIFADRKTPSSYIVYDVNGSETQEPMVKMNVWSG